MFCKKTRSTVMVAKPTSCSWDIVDCRYVLISSSLEKLLSPAARIVRKILKATERFGKFAATLFIMKLPFWRHLGFWGNGQLPGLPIPRAASKNGERARRDESSRRVSGRRDEKTC
ncbi:hypothetical protein AVEN_58754-1 [Araneus ventricosus]|uniref:Uncharacterized protein n=1 Tax=Araneus ventricosus TaxID=182803 RepID=A0A4Y2G362_ARAVE|nr:hypothetical protein AVEN_58754-1 [Araneus ventricosus]